MKVVIYGDFMDNKTRDLFIKRLTEFSKSDVMYDILDYFTFENHYFKLYNCELYAYLRVSTNKQEFDRQILELYRWLKRKNIKIFINNIYCDRFTGKKLDRKNYNEVRNLLKKNDYFLISNVNRLGRGNADEGYENVKEEWHWLKSKGVRILISEDELNEYISAPLPFESKEVTLNKMYLQDIMFINILYKDCLKILEVSNSTKNGLVTAKADGKIIGKPRTNKASHQNFINTLNKMLDDKIGQDKACIRTGFPSDTFKRDLKKCYNLFNTKDYKTILEKVKKINKWPL